MIKTLLKEKIEAALVSTGRTKQPVVIERSGDPERGDFACGVAMKFRDNAEMPPLKIAEEIAEHLMPQLCGIAELQVVAPGYLNFRLQNQFLQSLLQEIHVRGPECGLRQIDEYAGSPSSECLRENPAFLIPYAHVHCCAILRLAQEPGYDQVQKLELEPVLSAEKWQLWSTQYKQSASVFAWTVDENEDSNFFHRKLILQLAQFADESMRFQKSAQVVKFAHELAKDLQDFCASCCVIADDEQSMRARLGIVYATKLVLANAAKLIGWSLPTIW